MTQNPQAQNRKTCIRGTVPKLACPERNRAVEALDMRISVHHIETCESQDVCSTHAKYRTNRRAEMGKGGAVPYMRISERYFEICEFRYGFSESEKNGKRGMGTTGRFRNMRITVQYFKTCELRYGIPEHAKCGHSVPNMRISVQSHIYLHHARPLL